MKYFFNAVAICLLIGIPFKGISQDYKIVGTGVIDCYDNNASITCPALSSAPFYGQFPGVNIPSYHNNGDGTISDLNTGLMWQSNPDVNGDNNGTMTKADKLTWAQIQTKITTINSQNYAGYNDWRIPTIKELYSLTYWNGTDPSGLNGTSTAGLVPFIDTIYFPFAYGDQSAGERIIDSQYASGTVYNEQTFPGSAKLFGFNFADGRIKGYDTKMPDNSEKVFSFIAVRGNLYYGINRFYDNGDSTITDSATNLVWMKNDSRSPMNWEDALAWTQIKNAANYCGHNDWRLPNTKELQSIVDYTRSPGSTNSAAINPVFNCTSITNEAGYTDYPWFWTSTTHKAYNGMDGNAIYVCFGRGTGWMQTPGHTYYSLVDVHGAGCQRSSPKSGTFLGNLFGVDSLGNSVYGLGPQGDVLRVNNFVRLVRDLNNGTGLKNFIDPGDINIYPNPAGKDITILLPPAMKKAVISISNAFGQIVIVSQLTLIDVSQLPNGIYILNIHSNSGDINRKIVINR